MDFVCEVKKAHPVVPNRQYQALVNININQSFIKQVFRTSFNII